MRLRRRQPGDYVGTALYTMEGHWVVSVSRYGGWNAQEGYLWDSIPAEHFFRADVLRRQVRSAGLPMDVSFRAERLLLKPIGRRRRTGIDGAQIRRFMNRNYGRFGPDRRRVEWSWEIRQYD